MCLREGSKEKERVRVEDEEAGKSQEKQPETREAGDFSRMPREGRLVVTSSECRQGWGSKRQQCSFRGRCLL